MNAPLIGARVQRKEDYRFLTGSGQYTDDVALPNQSYAVFVRSPHAHAVLKKIDAEKARKSPGVLAVYTGADLAAAKVGGLPCGWLITGTDGKPMKEPPFPPLAQGKVRHVGERVAVVVAETLAQARDAADQVKVDYEELPAVVDVRKASSGTPLHEIALQGREPIDEQEAVDVVDLVAERAGEELRSRVDPLLAVGVQAAHGHLGRPDGGAVVPGNGQAALHHLLLAGALHELGIDELDDLLRIVAHREVDDDDPEGHVDLGGRQADAGGGVHGLDHVVQEVADGVVDRLHRP